MMMRFVLCVAFVCGVVLGRQQHDFTSELDALWKEIQALEDDAPGGLEGLFQNRGGRGPDDVPRWNFDFGLVTQDDRNDIKTARATSVQFSDAPLHFPATRQTALSSTLSRKFSEIFTKIADKKMAAVANSVCAGKSWAFVVAGSVGRSEMSPFSDVDYLVLHDESFPDACKQALQQSAALFRRYIEGLPTNARVDVCEYFAIDKTPALLNTASNIASYIVDTPCIGLEQAACTGACAYSVDRAACETTPHIKWGLLDAKCVGGTCALASALMSGMQQHLLSDRTTSLTNVVRQLKDWPEPQIEPQSIETKGLYKIIQLPVTYIYLFYALKNNFDGYWGTHRNTVTKLRFLAQKGLMHAKLAKKAEIAYDLVTSLRMFTQFDKNRATDSIYTDQVTSTDLLKELTVFLLTPYKREVKEDGSVEEVAGWYDVHAPPFAWYTQTLADVDTTTNPLLRDITPDFSNGVAHHLKTITYQEYQRKSRQNL